MSILPETPLLTKNLSNNTLDPVSLLPRSDLASFASMLHTKKRNRYPEQDSFELSLFKSFAQLSQGIEKISKALQAISIAVERGQTSIALPTMEFDEIPVKDIESLRLLEIKLKDPDIFKEFVSNNDFSVNMDSIFTSYVGIDGQSYRWEWSGQFYWSNLG